MPKGQLTDEDISWLLGSRGVVPAVVASRIAGRSLGSICCPPSWGSGPACAKMVPIDALTPEQVVEDLLEDLHHYATRGTAGPFVIPETERVKACLAERGE